MGSYWLHNSAVAVKRMLFMDQASVNSSQERNMDDILNEIKIMR